jgi:Tfp pilus assembly protein PilF
MDIIPPMRFRSTLTALMAMAVLAGCTLFRSPPAPPAPPTTPSGGGPQAGTAQPSPQPQAPPASPETPTPSPSPAPPRQFHLGSATSALVTYAHQQAASGDTAQAAATLERAVRIEPDNPLVWIELGRVRLAENNPTQANAMGRKALALATGDPAAQSSAWHLIADALRSRGDNAGAADADSRAQSLAPH